MNGKFNPDDSWEQAPAFDLDNGFQAVISYSPHYGEFICRLIYPNKKTYWHCSNGLGGLPEFAQPWIKVVVESCGIKLVRPQFEKIWD